MNVLINLLQPYIGFDAAVILTTPLALFFVHRYHDRYRR